MPPGRRRPNILKTVPGFACKEGCADCCGPITMSPLEWKRIIARTGITNLKAKMATVMDAAFSGKPCHCPLLGADKKCTVYDIRPAICVLYGSSTANHLTCPHDCKPANPLNAEQTSELMNKVEAIGGRASLDAIYG